MAKKNVLLICGGGGTEHDISLISAKYIFEKINDLQDHEVFWVEIKKDGRRVLNDGRECELRKAGEIIVEGEPHTLHFAIPCIHGPPGETGEIQSVFEMMGLPYLGSGPEASRNCFNKVTTKLWFDALDIPNTPYIFLSSPEDWKKAKSAMEDWGSLFIKASSQGSSIGCYLVENEKDLEAKIREAFKYSPWVLIEKKISGRELEVSCYNHEGNLIATAPGEILCPDGFYDFEEKYAENSKTTTSLVAKVDSDKVVKIQELAKKAFLGMKLSHLARVDFFLTDAGEIYINEINTFPGMTPISMFPKMMEETGLDFGTFIKTIIKSEER